MKKILIFLIFMLILCNYSYSQNTNHNIGLFLGGKFIKKTDSFAPTTGLNYEYKFSSTKPLLGIGMISEETFNETIELNGALALYIHPTEKLRLFIAPGVYYSNFGIAPANTEVTKYELDTQYGTQLRVIMQFGGEYYFKINSFYLSPFLKFEIIENNYRAFLGLGVSYNI